jgi:hypothetical protein
MEEIGSHYDAMHADRSKVLNLSSLHVRQSKIRTCSKVNLKSISSVVVIVLLPILYSASEVWLSAVVT